MEFLPLSRRRSSARNVPSGEERGETDVFAGYAKWRYKICICSVILREFEAFRKFKGYSVIFPKSLIFLIPLSITFLNPKLLGVLFLQKLA